MERLNYHHLLYFYTVAQEGSVARASSRLGLKQPTVSAQIHALEEELGRKLLERSGRGLKVTAAGETVLQYAASIFALGAELRSALDGRAEESPQLNVGVSSSLPPTLVAALLRGIMGLKPRPMLTVVEASAEALATPSTSRGLQLVLSDLQMPAGSGASQSRLLLESAVEVFAPEPLARKLRKDFPARLAGVPVLLPSAGALRRMVESWISVRKQPVKIAAQMANPEEYAAAAEAVVFAPALMRERLKKSYGLLPVGELKDVRWRVFAVAAGKGAKNPALDAVMRTAKGLL